MEDAYLDPKSPASFGSINALYEAVRSQGISRKSVKDFLASQSAYTKHATPHYRFKKRMLTLTYGYMDLCQADLAEMQQFYKQNNGIRFLLVIVEVLSNFLWVQPLKTKKTEEVVTAFERLLSSGKMTSPCRRLQTDEGTEFMSNKFKELMKKYEIIHFQTHSRDVKASVADVHIRELKRKIYKYLTHKGTKRYIDFLPDIVDGLNNRKRRKIKMRPVDVNYDTAGVALKRRYPNIFAGVKRFSQKFKFKKNDTVRISMHKEKLRHGYLPTFSDEVFVIKQLVSGDPPRYKIMDLSGEEIEGLFYHQELIRVIM